MDAAAARKEEILAKKAKLEELRRTRVLREQELKKSKQDATTGIGTIGTSNRIATDELNIDLRRFLTIYWMRIPRRLSMLHDKSARFD